jgi:hypothetical protein
LSTPTFTQLLQRVRKNHGSRAMGPYARYDRFGGFWEATVYEFVNGRVEQLWADGRYESRAAALEGLYEALR